MLFKEGEDSGRFGYNSADANPRIGPDTYTFHSQSETDAQGRGCVGDWNNKEPKHGKSRRKSLSGFGIFRLSGSRSRAKSGDSFFSSGLLKGKEDSRSQIGLLRGKADSANQMRRRRWNSEQRSWSFLQKIDLEGRYVDDDRPDDQIAALSLVLVRNTNILELNLSWNMIGDAGARSLGEFVSKNRSLKKLDLSKNWKMGDEGGVALAWALCKNTTLEDVSLTSCKKIGDKAAKAFAQVLGENTSLMRLSLGDCRIGPFGARYLADALCTNRTLTEINLSHNSFGLDGARKLALCLQRNTSLLSLDMGACDIGDEGALLFGAALGHNSTLESLCLRRNNIRNTGAMALESALDENGTLESLDLNHNYIPVGLLGTINNCLSENTKRKMGVDLESGKLKFSESLGVATINKTKSRLLSREAVSDGRDIMRQTRESLLPLLIPLDYLKACTEDFAADRRLGQGAFGEVFLGVDKTLRRRFAVKRMKVWVHRDEDDAARARNVFRREIEAFKCFRHPNIARLHAFFLSEDLQGPQCLVFDLAANGSLDKFLRSDEVKRQLYWATRISIASGIAQALKYLHQGDAAHFGSCFHGDIKPHNICLKKDFTPLLIDCGLSVCFPSEDSDMTLSIYGSSGRHVRGTIGYICPTYAENFAWGRSQSYTGACDVYSLGIVLCELFTGVLQRTKVEGEEFHIFDRYSEDGRLKRDLASDADLNAGPWQLDHHRKFADLATQCIRKNPEGRPSISDVEGRLSSLSSSAKPWTSSQRNCLVFLFSNPLAWMDAEGVLQPVTKLNIGREMNLVRQCVQDSKKDIVLSFDAATCDRLQELVSARCGCLHFAGHGMPCSTLVFEDGSSGCAFVHANDLSALIPHREPFKFVFVSACHSEHTGKAFVDAGVKHVVCCEQESELLDDAAATFTQSFYSALCNGYTVKHAFDVGVGHVYVKHNVKESNKFKLLPDCEDHDVPVFDAMELEWEEERISQHLFPSPVVFEGREVVMHQAISTIISRRRLVTLAGKNGIGRSSLALAIAGYIQDRLRGIHHIENIIFVQRRGGEATGLEGLLVRPLLDQLRAAGVAAEGKSQDACDALQLVCSALSKVKALVIFDDFDGIEDMAKHLLCVLYEKASEVQVLCVAQRPINFISGAVIEKCIKVGPLDPTSSAKLFGKACPFADTGPKQKKLLAGISCKESSGGSMASRKSSEQLIDVINEGCPRRIIEAAKSMSERGFLELSSMRDEQITVSDSG